jgi:hypothetical protein
MGCALFRVDSRAFWPVTAERSCWRGTGRYPKRRFAPGSATTACMASQAGAARAQPGGLPNEKYRLNGGDHTVQLPGVSSPRSRAVPTRTARRRFFRSARFARDNRPHGRCRYPSAAGKTRADSVLAFVRLCPTWAVERFGGSSAEWGNNSAAALVVACKQPVKVSSRAADRVAVGALRSPSFLRC